MVWWIEHRKLNIENVHTYTYHNTQLHNYIQEMLRLFFLFIQFEITNQPSQHSYVARPYM